MGEQAPLLVVKGGPVPPRPIRLVATEKAPRVNNPSEMGRGADRRVIPMVDRLLPRQRAETDPRMADLRVSQTGQAAAKASLS